MEWRLDCKYFKGEKPCKYGILCENCDHYEPMGKRILIIKLRAMGDVLRTTPLLYGLKKKYPESFISWLVDKENLDLLKGNPYIDRIFAYNLDSILRLQVEKYDLVISLDKAVEGASLAMMVRSDEKLGYGLSEEGNLFPLNPEAEYSFKLGISDELKFKQNIKTYQETIFEVAKLDYERQEYIFELGEEENKFGREFLERHNIREDGFIIGLNTGSGSVWATKKWIMDGFVQLAIRLHDQLKAKVLLLGGPEEVERNRQIKSRVGNRAIDTGCDNSLRQFAGLINCCHLVVSGDTIAMHLGIALKKKVVAIFGPTCGQEVELYGRGEKIVSDTSCVPCYRGICDRDMECMRRITADRVFETVAGLLR